MIRDINTHQFSYSYIDVPSLYRGIICHGEFQPNCLLSLLMLGRRMLFNQHDTKYKIQNTINLIQLWAVHHINCQTLLEKSISQSIQYLNQIKWDDPNLTIDKITGSIMFELVTSKYMLNDWLSNLFSANDRLLIVCSSIWWTPFYYSCPTSPNEAHWILLRPSWPKLASSYKLFVGPARKYIVWLVVTN